MKNLFYFSIILCFLFIGAANPYDEKKHAKVFYGTLGKVSKFIEKKYKLTCIGSGGKAFGGPITKFSLSFDIRAPLSREQLRKLLIDCSKDFLTIVNTDKEVQPYLANRPFTLENIEIIIFNNDKTGRDVFDPQISVADITNKCLSFQTTDPNQKYGYKNDYKETYEEAVKLIQESEKAKS